MDQAHDIAAAAKTIAVLGGDARQAYAARALLRAGFRVVHFGVPQAAREIGEAADSLAGALDEADILLGPLPFLRDDSLFGCRDMPRAEFEAHLSPRHTLVAGCVPEPVRALCAKLDVKAFALLDREDYTLLNAVPTSEGAIAEAIVRGPGNIQRGGCLVLGYGRCGKVLARQLKGMGAQLRVGVRRWESACAVRSDGFEALDLTQLPLALPETAYIWNTIPAPVLGEALLRLLPEEAVIIDIAAAPGGTDFPAAKALGLRAGLFPGLPGRYAPKAAGEAVAQATQVLLREEGLI
ncbi:MAG: hypothetical protein FWH26_06900 [Oscillospiraceae bacterium]|nr:hypothetical protein [Oscillospiraceae bacterium]